MRIGPYRVRLGRRSVWFWVFLAVVVILLLGLLFGGYRKGTRIDSGLGAVHGPIHTSVHFRP
jgi:hypothetical protein